MPDDAIARLGAKVPNQQGPAEEDRKPQDDVAAHPGKTSPNGPTDDRPCGVYLHIPFCRKACHYCDFHFSTSTSLRNGMVEAILQEMRLTPGRGGHRAATVYFGGGTPSLLPPADIRRLLDGVRQALPVAVDAEVTLEANPDDIDEERLAQWRDIGINRLSIGIQSFRDEDLRWMNRSHDARQALEAVDAARRAGIAELSIDLIFGLPGLSMADWEANLDIALALGVPHLSAYALTVEKGTPLDAMVHRRRRQAPDPGQQADQYLRLLERAEAAGYEAYEISNLCLPGHRSRHNSAYWQGTPYFGFGPSAHSFDGTDRRWNIAANAAYIQAIRAGGIPAETETLTPTQRLNEYVLTALRRSEGIDLGRVAERWGMQEADRLREAIAPAVREGKAHDGDGHLRLTHAGRLFADGIAAALFR
jgi:oxygen-independent coproporphyrinogen-3 oxidase